ncbi:MAG: RagB/SusD family nutrient uptake outer membrane protein [Chlorobi bacterium]|nr:RagB/SusD family nutrient uptake outer membrane protein [Chlorobiota bacterium]
MKNIKYFILIILGATTLFSCSDGFLKENVYDFKSNNNFFQTPDDADQAMIGTYKFLADMYRQSMIEMLTQNSGAFNKHRLSTVWISGTYTSATKEIYQTWQYAFQLINGCNDVIANVETMSSIDDSTRNIIIGEARFLRGWTYFVLVRMYLQLPIKLEPTRNVEDVMIPLSPSADIYEQVIIPDLEFAKENCPVRWSAANTGRATSGAAAAALAKVYLTLAGNEDGSEYWAKARDEAKWVMDNGGYSLVSDFGKLWETGVKNTEESIFEVQYMRGVNTGSGYAKIFTPGKSGLAAKGGGWGRSRITQKNYDDFANAYPGDYRIEKSTVTIDGLSGFIDIRKDKFIPVYPTKKYNKKTQAWPYVGKWIDPEAPDNFAADNNFIVIRYADVLLIYAEAENEVNGPTAEAYDAVDMILERARNADGTPREQPANWERTLTKEEFRDKVWNERRFELLGELKLWFDLVRKGWDKFRQFKEDDNAYGFKPVPHGVYEKNMYYPIPSLEISANDAISVEDQNPGY